MKQIKNPRAEFLVKRRSAEDLRVFLFNFANLDFEFLTKRFLQVGGLDSLNLLEEKFRQGKRIALPEADSVVASIDPDNTALHKALDEIEPHEWRHAQRFFERYKDIIPPDPYSESRDEIIWLCQLQVRLREAWSQPDFRSKQYGVFWIMQGLNPNPQSAFFRMIQSNYLLVPAEVPFERALFQFLRDSDLAKYCGNPECRAPFFFAIRGSQKYCSVDCGKPALRKAKLKWWDINRKRKKVL